MISEKKRYEQSVSLNPTVVEELHPSVGEVATCRFHIIRLGADLRWDSQSASCNNQVQKVNRGSTSLSIRSVYCKGNRADVAIGTIEASRCDTRGPK